MRIALICAMEEELVAVTEFINLPLVNILEKASNKYFHYQSDNDTIISVVSGIGKVNAAVTTQILLDIFDVEYVINVGVAGSLTPELTFGDVVVANDLVQHDFDITAFGVPLGQIARMDVFGFAADEQLNALIMAGLAIAGQQIQMGRIVSGDQFIDDAAKAKFLNEHFGALACEMEGAAIAHVCYLNQKPFAVVRALSDMAGQSGSGAHSFEELKHMAANRAALVVKNLLENISA